MCGCVANVWNAWKGGGMRGFYTQSKISTVSPSTPKRCGSVKCVEMREGMMTIGFDSLSRIITAHV